MEINYSSNKKMIERMQGKTLLNKIRDHPIISGSVAGLVVGTGLMYGVITSSAKTIKPYVDKAAYQIEQKANYEDRFNKFLSDSYRR